jgi:hypothetical protein
VKHYTIVTAVTLAVAYLARALKYTMFDEQVMSLPTR